MLEADSSPVVIYTLARIRYEWNNVVEMLLETDGSDYEVPAEAYLFIDLIGLDDELVDTVPVRKYPAQYLVPIGISYTQYQNQDSKVESEMRVAKYYPTNARAEADIAAVELPGWKVSKPEQNLITICLKRYRRAL